MVAVRLVMLVIVIDQAGMNVLGNAQRCITADIHSSCTFYEIINMVY